jgi:hypothetical protein
MMAFFRQIPLQAIADIAQASVGVVREMKLSLGK